MKMTDQTERDYFQVEMADGSENSATHDLKVASVVMAAFVFAALLMIWLGR